MSFLLDGPVPGLGPVRAMFPGTCRMKTLKSRHEYELEILTKKIAWLVYNPRRPDETLEDKVEIYNSMTEKAMPELVNVVGEGGLWRVPCIYWEDNWRACPTEVVADFMGEIEGRWQCFALGVEYNQGDVFTFGKLTPEEIHDISYGHFPPSLSLYGIPGPGICEGPAQPQMMSPHHPARSRAIASPYDDFDDGYAPHGPSRSVSLRQPAKQHHPLALPTSGAPSRSRSLREPAEPRSSGPQRPRHQVVQTQRPRKYISGPSDSSSDPDEVDSPYAAAKGKSKKTRGKPIPKPKPRQRSPSEDEEEEDEELVFDDDDDEPPTHLTPRPPPYNKPARHRGRSDDEDEAFRPRLSGRLAQASAGGRGSEATARRPGLCGRRNRGRSPEEEEEELPDMDPAEKERLEELKRENGYGG